MDFNPLHFELQNYCPKNHQLQFEILFGYLEIILKFKEEQIYDHYRTDKTLFRGQKAQ